MMSLIKNSLTYNFWPGNIFTGKIILNNWSIKVSKFQVERLFSDLLHTTNSLKNAKVQELKSAKHYEKGDSPDIIEDAVEPYRADNAKLVQENNKLHLELVKIKDELNALSKSKLFWFYFD